MDRVSVKEVAIFFPAPEADVLQQDGMSSPFSPPDMWMPFPCGGTVPLATACSLEEGVQRLWKVWV